MSTQVPESPAAARRLHPVRMINLVLLACVIVLVIFVIVPNWRRVRFRLTGQVTVDGSRFYLHPTDNFLTPLVLNHGAYEPTETQLLRDILKEGDVFLDVGANIGWYTVFASKAVGDTGKVIAFEPEPSNLAMLRRNVRLNGLKNVVVEGVALSNAPGSFKLFLERGNLGMHSLVQEYDGKHYVNVETVRLDDYWKDRGDIKLVKIDTEGAEGMILAGMRETLKKHRRLELIVEFAPQRWEKSGYDADKVLDELYRLGFRASFIDEAAKRVIPLGTPQVKDFHVQGDDSVGNLHLKR